MAMYLNFVKARRRYNEVGIDCRFNQGPPIAAAATPWNHVWLYYMAMQIDWVDATDTIVGGGHVGLQIYDEPALGSANRTVVNWGVYDNTTGVPNSTFRASIPIDPAGNDFLDIDNELSFGFDFQYTEWVRFRVFKSPKQDWVANEIKPGSGQSAPYVGTDQQPDEEAWRCSLQRLGRDEYPIDFHDVLIKSPRANRPLSNGQCWLEPIGSDISDLHAKWYYSPQADFRCHDLDGCGGNVIEMFSADYAAVSTNCNMSWHDAAGAVPGFIRLEGTEVPPGMTRTTADASHLPPPVGYWDARPANVAPAITDVSARVPTRRPYF